MDEHAKEQTSNIYIELHDDVAMLFVRLHSNQRGMGPDINIELLISIAGRVDDKQRSRGHFLLGYIGKTVKCLILRKFGDAAAILSTTRVSNVTHDLESVI